MSTSGVIIETNQWKNSEMEACCWNTWLSIKKNKKNRPSQASKAIEENTSWTNEAYQETVAQQQMVNGIFYPAITYFWIPGLRFNCCVGLPLFARLNSHTLAGWTLELHYSNCKHHNVIKCLETQMVLSF